MSPEQESYFQILAGSGLTEVDIWQALARAYSRQLLRKVPDVYLDASSIHGIGCFAADDLPSGWESPAGVMSILDRCLNHSPWPNLYLVSAGDGSMRWRAPLPVIAGEELVVNYLQVQAAKNALTPRVLN